MFKQKPKIPALGNNNNTQAFIKADGDVVFIRTDTVTSYTVKPPKPVVDLALRYSYSGYESLTEAVCVFEDGTVGPAIYDSNKKTYSIEESYTKDEGLRGITDAQKLCEIPVIYYLAGAVTVPAFLYISKENELVMVYRFRGGTNNGNVTKQRLNDHVTNAYIMGGYSYISGSGFDYYDVMSGIYCTESGEPKTFNIIENYAYNKPVNSVTLQNGLLKTNTASYGWGDSEIAALPFKDNVKSLQFIVDGQYQAMLLRGTNGRIGWLCEYLSGSDIKTNTMAHIAPYGATQGCYIHDRYCETLCAQKGKWGALDEKTFAAVGCDADYDLYYSYIKNNERNIISGVTEASTLPPVNFKGVNPEFIKCAAEVVDHVLTPSGMQTVGITNAGKVVPLLKDTSQKQAENLAYFNSLGILTTDCTGALESKKAISVPQDMKVTGITVSGDEPENTKRRVVFKVDGVWNRLKIADGVATLLPCTKSVSGTEINLTDNEITPSYVLENGNTAAELNSVTSVPAFAGKDVYVKAALYASEDAVKMPSFALGINAKTMKDTYISAQETQEYALGGDKITEVEYTPIAKDGGSIEISATIRTGEEWSKELSLDELKGLSGDAIKFKVKLSATTIGVSQAGIAKLTLTLRSSERLATATGNTSLTSKTQAFDIGMTYGRLYVKHGELRDAKISADIMFRETPKKREMYKIAEGTGKQQTVTLADTQVDFSTLQLFANNDRIPVFDFNSMENTVTFTAPDLSTVFATYEYEVEPEVWQPMQAQGTQGYTNTAGYASTSFAYQVTGTEKGYGAVRVNLEKPGGSVQDALLGIGTGRMQTFFLPHYAKVETLKLKNGTEEIARKNWNYDQESKMLRLIALKDREVTASYEYVAESPKVYGFVAAWNQ